MGTFSELGSGIIDTATDLIQGFGDQFSAGVDRQEVQNDIAKAKIQIALSNEARKAQRDKNLQNLAMYSVAFLMLLLAASVGANIYKKIK